MEFVFEDFDNLLSISWKVTMIYKYTSSFYCNRVLHIITPTKLPYEISTKLVQFLQQQCWMHKIKYSNRCVLTRVLLSIWSLFHSTSTDFFFLSAYRSLNVTPKYLGVSQEMSTPSYVRLSNHTVIPSSVTVFVDASTEGSISLSCAHFP